MTRFGVTAMLLFSTLLAATGAPAAPVDFSVGAPAGFPTEKVFLTGSAPALGPWRPDALRLRLGDDGRWHGRADLPPGPFEFKFTRGGWETVEVRADGGEAPNRRVAVGSGGGRVETAVEAKSEPGFSKVFRTLERGAGQSPATC